jgi:hypothetical protein
MLRWRRCDRHDWAGSEFEGVEEGTKGTKGAKGTKGITRQAEERGHYGDTERC